MAPWVPAAIIGGSMLASSAMGALSSLSSRSSGGVKRKDTQLEKKAFRQYSRDLNSAREAVVRERKERTALSERQYESVLENWKLRTKALDEMINTWKGYERNPTKVPAWQGFRDALLTQAKTQVRSLSGQMARAGRTGGAQDRMRKDVSEAVLTKLGTEMLSIQKQARTKQLELEGQRTPEPFLGYLGDPELTKGISQYQGRLGGGVGGGGGGFQPIDLSGFGMMGAQMYRDYARAQATPSNVDISPQVSNNYVNDTTLLGYQQVLGGQSAGYK